MTRLLVTIGLGAAASYLLDPDRGEERRKNLRKNIYRARKAGRKARRQAGL